MKAIKIDVRNKRVTEITLERGIDAIYRELECSFFTCIDLPNGDALYIDDEGLLLDEPIGAFMYQGLPQPLSGHGLIIGTDVETGDSTDCLSTLEAVKGKIEFPPVQLLKGVPLEPVFIPLTDEELAEFMRTGQLPLGKNPPSLQ